MRWSIVSNRDLAALRAEVAAVKRQRDEADLAADVRFQMMQNLFKLERELLEEHLDVWRRDVQAITDRESVNCVMQFESLKVALLQELSCLRDRVQRELEELHEKAQLTFQKTTERAVKEQNALKSRLLGSLKALTPAKDLNNGCAHEWPADWQTSPDLKYDSQPCVLCEQWRFRFSAFWTQHHPADQMSMWYGITNHPDPVRWP